MIWMGNLMEHQYAMLVNELDFVLVILLDTLWVMAYLLMVSLWEKSMDYSLENELDHVLVT